jgi:NDP-sugar pyrophosphorylase family protein
VATDDKVRAIDIGGARWHDIDTPQMLQYAEEDMIKRVLRSVK